MPITSASYAASKYGRVLSMTKAVLRNCIAAGSSLMASTSLDLTCSYPTRRPIHLELGRPLTRVEAFWFCLGFSCVDFKVKSEETHDKSNELAAIFRCAL